MNYILRHWRGHLSLAKSFWLNCVLLTFFLKIFQGLVERYAEKTDTVNAYRIFCIYLIFHLFLFFPWKMIGLWRACRSHIKKYDRKFWPHFLQAFIILSIAVNAGIVLKYSPFYRAMFSTAFLVNRSDFYTLQLEREGTILCLRGKLEFGVSDDVEKFLKTNSRIEGIVLDTPGGRWLEGRRLAKLISHYRINTYAHGQCNSAGTIVFIQGEKRFLVEGTYMGFHQGGITDSEVVSQGRIPENITQKKTSEMAEFMMIQFEQQGIKKDFLEKLKSVPFEEIWCPSVEELLDAGIIHGVVNSDLELIENK